jgi:hypothetical protein
VSSPTDPTDPNDIGPNDVDPHDPRVETDLLDSLALAALGQPVDRRWERHTAQCPRCQRELSGFRQAVLLAREAGHPRDQAAQPSPAVWDGIVAELGLAPVTVPQATALSSAAPRSARHRPVPRTHWRAGLVAACAAVLLAGAAAVGYTAGTHSSSSSTRAAAIAHLAAMPGGPDHVVGTATVHTGQNGADLSITTAGLPLREGYYEVWMFDPSTNQMVAIGTLAADGAGTFPMPPGLDPNAYHVVDVSAQDYNGNPAHQQSVLRGPLTS